MNAASPFCLRALRILAPPSSPHLSRCSYAGHPSRPAPAPKPPPYTSTTPDAERFTPLPLSRPIGLPHPSNSSADPPHHPRTLSQRCAALLNPSAHVARRATLTQRIARPYFRDWTALRHAQGKQFLAPTKLFRREVALWMPEFSGRTLRAGMREGVTSAVLQCGRVSVVRIYSSAWGAGQVETFTGWGENAELWGVLESAGGQAWAQVVDVNVEADWLKWLLLRVFAYRLRQGRTEEEQGRYFLVRGVGDSVREAIGAGNHKVGSVYLVDGEGRIRWAGSARAGVGERESLVRGLRKLVVEAERAGDM